MTPLTTPAFPFARIISGSLVALCTLVIVGYALYQSRFLIQGPQVSLSEEPAIVQHGHTVTLTGTTANITALYLQGRPIVTDEYGHFTETVVLENGYTIVRLDARDRYGRTTHLERSFVYQPPITNHPAAEQSL
jgi:hypothetical protein